MSALSFFGYFFLGVGPGIVYFFFFIAPKSFLVLLTLFSCFLWLLVLLITSAIFKGFLPVQETVASYAGMLLGSLVIQELTRYGVWRLHKACLSKLDAMALSSHHRFALIDKLYLAMAWGYGHGACQVIFFFVSILPLCTNDTTYYSSMCPRMSIFLTGALYSLAFGMLLCSVMVTAMDGYHTGNWVHIAWAPAMHFAASLATLGNMRQDGCLYVMPILLLMGVCNVVYAGQVCWRKGIAIARSPGGGVPLLPDQFLASDAIGGAASSVPSSTEEPAAGGQGGPNQPGLRQRWGTEE